MIKRSIVASLALVSLISTTVFAQAPLPGDTQKAYKALLSTKEFAMGGVGFAGRITESEKALWVLVQQKDTKRLTDLSKGTNPAARLYAVLGLHYLQHSGYKKQVIPLPQSKDTVGTFSGCMSSFERISAVADRFDNGDYDKLLQADMKRLAKSK